MDHNRLSDYSPSGDDAPASAHAASLPAGLPLLAAASDLYAMAWAQSQRDYELDRLFNASFYYEI